MLEMTYGGQKVWVGFTHLNPDAAWALMEIAEKSGERDRAEELHKWASGQFTELESLEKEFDQSHARRGATICTVFGDKERETILIEGVSFCSYSEPRFDRRKGRKYAFASAVQGLIPNTTDGSHTKLRGELWRQLFEKTRTIR